MSPSSASDARRLGIRTLGRSSLGEGPPRSRQCRDWTVLASWSCAARRKARRSSRERSRKPVARRAAPSTTNAAPFTRGRDRCAHRRPSSRGDLDAIGGRRSSSRDDRRAAVLARGAARRWTRTPVLSLRRRDVHEGRRGVRQGRRSSPRGPLPSPTPAQRSPKTPRRSAGDPAPFPNGAAPLAKNVVAFATDTAGSPTSVPPRKDASPREVARCAIFHDFAEEKGFEPLDDLRHRRFSKPLPSTARPLLRMLVLVRLLPRSARAPRQHITRAEPWAHGTGPFDCSSTAARARRATPPRARARARRLSRAIR